MLSHISITIAIIALVVSVISPIGVAIVNNIHQRKLLKLKMKHDDMAKSLEVRRAVYERFLQASGSCIAEISFTDTLNNLGKHFDEIYLYTPESMWDDIDTLHEVFFNKHDAGRAIPLLRDISKGLSHNLSKTQIQVSATIDKSCK